jgi:hypothetical protein
VCLCFIYSRASQFFSGDIDRVLLMYYACRPTCVINVISVTVLLTLFANFTYRERKVDAQETFTMVSEILCEAFKETHNSWDGSCPFRCPVKTLLVDCHCIGSGWVNC